MASRDSRTTQQLLVALGFEYSKFDHDSLVRAALRELEQRRALEQRMLASRGKWQEVQQ